MILPARLQAVMQSMYLPRWDDNQMYYQACINAGWNAGQDTFYGPNPQNGVPAWGCYDSCSSNCCIMNPPAIQTPPLYFLSLSIVNGGSTVLNMGASTSEPYWWVVLVRAGSESSYIVNLPKDKH